MSDEGIIRKRVDEDWKERVQREKAAADLQAKPAQAPASGREQPREARPASRPGTTSAEFGNFISSLSMQAMMFLGELPSAGTNQREVNLEQARTVIDMLGMLQEKTKGNLSSEEANLLEGVLYELRMIYVAKGKNP